MKTPGQGADPGLLAALERLAMDETPPAADAAEPDPEELLDYLAGRLEPEDEARLGRRLVADPAAAAMLLDLAELAEAHPAGTEAPADLAARAGWRDLQGRLRAGEPARPAIAAARPWQAWAAAALLLTSLGLGFQVWRLEERLRAPIADLQTLELAAFRSDVSSRELAPGERLRVVVRPSERCEIYTAELAGPGAGWTIALRRDAAGLLNFVAPVAPGDYTLKLAGCSSGSPEVFAFRIEAKGPPG